MIACRHERCSQGRLLRRLEAHGSTLDPYRSIREDDGCRCTGWLREFSRTATPVEAIAAEVPAVTAVRLVPPHLVAQERAARAHDARCPMRVPGATVTANELEEGVALYFTTSGDVTELRQRVRELALTHAHEHAGSKSYGCGCPLLGNDGSPLMAEASTVAEPTPAGARLVLVPNERNEASRLRERVKDRLQTLAHTDCRP